VNRLVASGTHAFNSSSFYTPPPPQIEVLTQQVVSLQRTVKDNDEQMARLRRVCGIESVCVAAMSHPHPSSQDHAQELQAEITKRLVAEKASRMQSPGQDERLIAAQQAELEALTQLNNVTQNFKVWGRGC